MNVFTKIAIILVLWLPFSLGGVVAIPASLLAIWNENIEYGKNVLRAMDKVLAAVLGWSGRYTLSSELGAGTTSSFGLRLRLVYKLLNFIQAGHCEGAAKREGLL